MNKILKSLGYRKVAHNKWAKPFAYNIFIYHTEEKTIINSVMGLNNNLLIWKRDIFEGEIVEFLDFIKWFEADSHIEYSLKSNFEFLTYQDNIDLI